MRGAGSRRFEKGAPGAAGLASRSSLATHRRGARRVPFRCPGGRAPTPEIPSSVLWNRCHDYCGGQEEALVETWLARRPESVILTIGVIPPLLFTLFAARQIIAGMTAGAVKG